MTRLVLHNPSLAIILDMSRMAAVRSGMRYAGETERANRLHLHWRNYTAKQRGMLYYRYSRVPASFAMGCREASA